MALFCQVGARSKRCAREAELFVIIAVRARNVVGKDRLAYVISCNQRRR